MSDLISRRDAINALVEKGQRSRRYKLGETWELNGNEIREALDDVPSAEPEIIRCKDSIVYRKDVVEALYQALRTQLQGTFTDSMSLAMSMAQALPSAEPETAKTSDLISRQMVIQKMRDLYNEDLDAYGVEIPEMFDCDRAIEALQNLPSAEPERKKGNWIATYSDCGGDVWVSWKCSNCNYVRKKGWEHTNDGEKPDVLFCEICGADMRGEEE